MTPLKIRPTEVENFLKRDGFTIFLFHGVIEKQVHRIRNYTGKHIESIEFSRYLDVLTERGNPLSMDQILQYLDQKEPPPPNSFALTFDDGFENNFSIAEPILRNYSVPAMVYITTDFIDRNAMSWIDRVEYAVELTKEKSIHADWCNFSFPLITEGNRIQFLTAIRRHVKATHTCNPSEFADRLCLELGFPEISPSNDPLDKKLSWEQIRSLSQTSEYLSFGGHSHTHPILSFLSPNELDYELDTSLNLMREKGGIRSTHYSYPEGLEHCYSRAVIEGLRKRGVRCCPTAIAGINNQLTDPFHLSRVMVA